MTQQSRAERTASPPHSPSPIPEHHSHRRAPSLPPPSQPADPADIERPQAPRTAPARVHEAGPGGVHEQVCERLNARFAAGVPSDDLETAGVLVHELDKFNRDDDRLWLPCPRVCPQNERSVCECDAQSDRISASMLNARFPRVPPSARLPLFVEAKGIGPRYVGFVMRPNGTEVSCAYATDMGTSSVQCEPQQLQTVPLAERAAGPFERRSCTPGCAGTHAMGLNEAMAQFEALGRSPGMERLLQTCGIKCTYNEVIVPAASWLSRLPESLEAIYYHAGRADGHQLAAHMHATLVRRYGHRASAIPLLALRTNGVSTHPFALAPTPPAPPPRPPPPPTPPALRHVRPPPAPTALARAGAAAHSHPRKRHVVRELNGRFARGRPSDDVSEAGVLLRALDALTPPEAEASHTTPWLPVASSRATDRFSASLASRRLPYYFMGNAGEGVAGFVVAPAVANVSMMCSYADDAASINHMCFPPGASAQCLPGCLGANGQGPVATSEGWCVPKNEWDYRCPHHAAQLGTMLALHESRARRDPRFRSCTCCSWPECALYNEVLLDAHTWVAHLPWTIEAVFFSAGAAHAEATAREAHGAFLAHFALDAAQVPLVQLDLHNLGAPFTEVAP